MKKGCLIFILCFSLCSLVSCGATGQDRSRFEMHTWSEFQYDTKEHFRICLDEGCDAIDREEHLTYQKVCEEIQFCDVCHHEYGDVFPHQWENNVCTVCGENQSSAMLEYFHGEDYYVVAGIGDCEYADIEISPMHKWMPVTEIAEHAFSKATYVVSIVIPDSIKKIGWGAFSGCNQLQSIELPPDLESIEGYLFHNCKALNSVEIPDGVTHIGDHAFYHCESIKSLSLPSSLEELDGTPFAGCSALKKIMFDGTKKEFDAVKKADASIPKGISVSCTDGEWKP